jgi:tripartite-type tricarboxylate transporter receptor subunit TctC
MGKGKPRRAAKPGSHTLRPNLFPEIDVMVLARLLALCLAVLGAAASAPALAQGFPNKPVRLIVPFPPGGATDALARLMAERLAERWKQPVVIENKPGANTTLGTDVVAKSAPDGHVLGIVTGSHAINPLLTSKLPYDTAKDLTGVSLLTRFHMALYAHPSFAANTPAELVALARKEPGKVAYAAATTQSYLGMALLDMMAGTKTTYVPYKGSAQAATDLLGGHTLLMIDPVLASTLEHVKSGKLKLIGTLGAKPSELTPGVPVFASVVPGYDFSGVFGLVARGGTPPELIQRIRDEFVAVMALPEVAERIRSIGQEAVGSTPDEYNAYIAAETKKWEPVVKATGAKLD